jgi:glycosyltransferase involved in cell wall biosynthesis
VKKIRRRFIPILSKTGLLRPALTFYRFSSQLNKKLKNGTGDNLVHWTRQSTTRKIFVDISSIIETDHGGGIQRVQRSILENWSINAPKNFDVYAVYFSFTEKQFQYASPGQVSSWRPKHHIPSGVVKMSKGDIYLNADLNYRFTIDYENFYKFLKDRKVHTFFIVYDILPLSLPELFPEGVSEFHEKWFDVAIRHSTLICISKTVMNESIEYGTKKGISVRATSFNLGHDFSNNSAITKSPVIEKSTSEVVRFLVVSTIEIRKSHELVLDAFEILWSKGHDVELTLVGRPGWKVDGLIQRLSTHQYINQKLFWFSDLPDEQLTEVYKNSSALINASLGEGYGLPLIEASFHGLPLILRDIPVFREIAGDGAWYFDSNDHENLAESISTWLYVYRNLKIGPVSEIKTVTWKDTCEELLDIFNRA